LMKSDRIESVKLGKIAVDGDDVTDVLLNLLGKTSCDAIILGGITFAGFNIIDPDRINVELDVPVIVYSSKKPNNASMLDALKAHFPDWEKRWAPIKRLGEIYRIETKQGSPPIFFEIVGTSIEKAEDILKSSASLTRTPEPVRVARIVARGLTRSA
jgi:uncharacterized protein